jgi:hypothetical protein
MAKSSIDALSLKFYAPLAFVENISNACFWFGAALSIAVLFVDKTVYPILSSVVQTAFVVVVVAQFVLNLWMRLSLSTRAQEKRIADFLSNAFQFPLLAQPSRGYFDNSELESFRRIAASLLENLLFTKSILQSMFTRELIVVFAYLMVWMLSMLNRSADLGLITAVALVIFSEQLFSRFIRVVWLRAKTEGMYEDVYAIIQSSQKASSAQFRARVIDCLLRYETAKALAGISLSTTVFQKLDPALSAEWRQTADALQIPRDNVSSGSAIGEAQTSNE